jgi:hypothetical protein
MVPKAIPLDIAQTTGDGELRSPFAAHRLAEYHYRMLNEADHTLGGQRSRPHSRMVRPCGKTAVLGMDQPPITR